MEMHNALQGVTVAPDVALTDVEPETDIENVLPPDPPAIFFQKKIAPVSANYDGYLPSFATTDLKLEWGLEHDAIFERFVKLLKWT